MKILFEYEHPGLGAIIKDARKLSGQTVDDLAESVGVSRQSWYDVENEAVSVRLGLLRKIERQLQPQIMQLRMTERFAVVAEMMGHHYEDTDQ